MQTTSLDNVGKILQSCFTILTSLTLPNPMKMATFFTKYTSTSYPYHSRSVSYRIIRQVAHTGLVSLHSFRGT